MLIAGTAVLDGLGVIVEMGGCLVRYGWLWMMSVLRAANVLLERAIVYRSTSGLEIFVSGKETRERCNKFLG